MSCLKFLCFTLLILFFTHCPTHLLFSGPLKTNYHVPRIQEKKLNSRREKFFCIYVTQGDRLAVLRYRRILQELVLFCFVLFAIHV
jgi:hypothetical protein